MPETPNHKYNVPQKGTEDWHTPLNENFEWFDTDIEVRDVEANKGDYDPDQGAKYLATDTGVIYTGTGSSWEASMVVGQVDSSGEETIVSFGTGNIDGLSIDGDIEVSGTKHFVEAVETPHGSREIVYTATEAPTPRTEVSDVARLEDGQAELTLPDHFSLVTDPSEPILVQTTPYDPDSNGLVVRERSTSRILVEDQQGEGDYEFSYTVKGTRTGQADKPVVRIPEDATGDGQLRVRTGSAHGSGDD